MLLYHIAQDFDCSMTVLWQLGLTGAKVGQDLQVSAADFLTANFLRSQNALIKIFVQKHA